MRHFSADDQPAIPNDKWVDGFLVAIDFRTCKITIVPEDFSFEMVFELSILRINTLLFYTRDDNLPIRIRWAYRDHFMEVDKETIGATPVSWSDFEGTPPMTTAEIFAERAANKEES